MIYELQWTNETHFFIKIYLSFYSQKAHTVCCKFRDRWRDIYSERGLLLAPYLLPGSQGVPTLALPSKPYRPRRLWSLRIPSDWTDCLNLTAWFSCHVVSFRLQTCSTGLPRRTAILLFTNHNVTACQSIRGHQERTRNPCQQSLYNNGFCCFFSLI